MATQTITATVTDAATGVEQYARIVRVIRNMDFIKFCDKGNVVVPVRTETNPSPVKQSASNRQPGQSHTRTAVGGALNNEMATARHLTDHLADHMFGQSVSTDLASDILREFVHDGFVQVFERTRPRDDDDALDLESDDVRCAIKQAFEDADVHDCIRLGTESDYEEPESSSTDTKGKGKQTNSKGRGKRKQKTYTFKWSTFPKEPIDEDELVNFLNEITDRAFRFAQSKLARVVQGPKNRFAAQSDKNHALPLSYEPDGEDMRPDFLLLPAQAFSDGSKSVDTRYFNFTAARLVGEAKNKDLATGIEQVQRYARGLKRAQPWVHYVLAMVITKDKAVFIRGEGSGAERLDLILSDGRGCIEFIRILLGLALAEDIDLGQNPDIELKNETRTCEVNNLAHRCVTSNNVSSSATASRLTRTANTESFVVSSSAIATSEASLNALPISSRTRSASTASKRGASLTSNARSSSSRTRSASAASKHGSSLPPNMPPSSSRIRNAVFVRRQPLASASSTSSKRVHSEIGDGGLQGRQQQKKRKMAETVVMQEERMVFFPLRVYEYPCKGLLFTSSSIRGRGTTVFCVLDLQDASRRLALKMSWQDLERVADHAAVTKRLKENSHLNVVIPLKTFHAKREGQMCTTLGTIRGFLDEQIALLPIENRVLSISISELKRPVKYFWGVHDFVRGLRGALLGHQFLTSIGILHRDISENNIVLGVYPWEERGYLIDFDMAILQDVEEPPQTSLSQPANQLSRPAKQSATKPIRSGETKRVKGIRTGTFPYMSFNVLFGETHTHCDDVESFLYVLLLFFFSYAGPLPKEELHDAHDNGFVRPTGSGRLPHVRSWPQKFRDWADGEADDVGESKYFHIWHPQALDRLEARVEVKGCLENNWPGELQTPIRSLLRNTLKVFRESMKGGIQRTEVSHAQFIKTLDEWLIEHSELEDKYSSHPDFKDFRNEK